jgi:hypothetical protein
MPWENRTGIGRIDPRLPLRANSSTPSPIRLCGYFSVVNKSVDAPMTLLAVVASTALPPEWDGRTRRRNRQGRTGVRAGWPLDRSDGIFHNFNVM